MQFKRIYVGLVVNCENLRKIIAIAVLLLMQLSGQSQADSSLPVISSDMVERYQSMLPHMALLIDTNHQGWLPNRINAPFMPLSRFEQRGKIPTQLVTADFYLKFSFHNKEAVAKTYSLYPGTLINKMKLYFSNDGGKNYSSYPLANYSSGFIEFTAPPSQTSVYVLQLTYFKNNFNILNPSLIDIDSIESFKNELFLTQSERRTVGLVLSGMLIMLMLITLLNFIITRRIEFLYSTLYTFCMSVVIFFTAILFKNPSWFKGFYMTYIDFMMMMIGLIFYLNFTRKFLNADISFPTLDKLLKYLSSFVLAIIICYNIIHFGFDAFSYEIYFLNTVKFILLGAGILFIVLSFVVKNKLMNYIAFGAGVQIMFSIVSLLLGISGNEVSSIFNSPFFYYELGVISSIIFFLLGLFYKNKVELISKTKEQEAMKLEAEKQFFENQLAIYKAQQEERNRISADMHDDLGAGMTSIRLYSELAKAKAADTNFPELDKISSLSDELINNMNSIIWSMSSQNDTLGNMVAYIRSYTIEYLEGTGIKPTIQIPEIFPALVVRGTIRRNIFLLVKEALQNIVKHAEATEVVICMNEEPMGYSLTIHDNGKGIDLENIRQFSNGLKNMRKRMEDFDIDFSIENKNGTLIRLYKQTH